MPISIQLRTVEAVRTWIRANQDTYYVPNLVAVA